MPVCVPPVVVAAEDCFPDTSKFQPSTRTPEQLSWLKKKFEFYKAHHAAKTLTRFYPSLYEEYFGKWPPTPTAKDIQAAGGKNAVAIASIRKVEERVRDFELVE